MNLHPNVSPAVRNLIAAESNCDVIEEHNYSRHEGVPDDLSGGRLMQEAAVQQDENLQQESSTDTVVIQNRKKPPYGEYGGRYCCVVGCSNNQGRDVPRGISFHKFPKNAKRRQEWIQAVKRVKADRPKELWEPGIYDVICSAHFYGGKKSEVEGSPSYNPSIFPTHHVRPKTKADQDRFKRQERLEQRRKINQAGRQPEVEESQESMSTVQAEDDGQQVQGLVEEEGVQTPLSPSHMNEQDATEKELRKQVPEKLRICIPYAIQCNLPDVPGTSFSFCTDYVSCTEKATQVTSVPSNKKEKIYHKGCQAGDSTYKALPFHLFSDEQFKSVCGVDRNIADFLLHRSASLRDGRILKRKDKLNLLLTKFKLHVSFSVLGSFFGISQSLASSTFYECLDSLYDGVKHLIIWYDRDTVDARMPESFKALFPSTRCVIDCTEIETEQPSELRQQVLTYSHYKGRYTYKFLVGICPSGDITFVSRGYGGRSTDTEITIDSGFLNLIEEGDGVMSDKGFPSIQARLTERGGVLIMPPLRKGGKQFTSKENKDGYQCASVRVHVERAIRRLKCFKIMKFLPQHLVPYMDKIVVVICCIVNCFPDLIAQEQDDDVVEVSDALEENLHFE